MIEVVLVNERDEPIGTMEKMAAHRKAFLHRAFSVFILNHRGDMLLQKRALNKYHSGGLWTNACCSHPFPGEDILIAANRRLEEEMGFTTDLNKAFNFTYRSELDNGLTEFEFDHVFIGEYNDHIIPNKEEVNDYCFKSFEDIRSSLLLTGNKYTAWFHIAFPMVEKWITQNHNC